MPTFDPTRFLCLNFVEPASSKVLILYWSSICKDKSLTREGFDPPTFGLWAQHAASAPPRLMFIFLLEEVQLLLHILYSQLLFKLF